MEKCELAAGLQKACQNILDAEQELTDIDSRFGDADHGVTMAKIASAISQAVAQSKGGIQEMLDDAAMAVMMINGGSAVPLWNTWLDAMQEHAPGGDSITESELKTMFTAACQELSALSKAKIGDKTMMDTIIPATEAIAACEGSCQEILEAGARAAEAGADATRNFVARFGRARSYGIETLGTPDAGAVSVKYFFLGLAGR